MLSVLARFRRDPRGASLVEFSLIAPVLITMGMGMLEFGLALYGHHVITTGVHDAARYLARFDDPTTKEAAAKSLAVTGSVSGTTPRLSWVGTSNIAVTYRDIANAPNPTTGLRAYRGPDVLKLVTVSATATYTGFGVLPALGLGPSLAISVAHEERVIHE